MSKDGRETQWRQITEHDKPEMVALPDGLDEKYVEFLLLGDSERAPHIIFPRRVLTLRGRPSGK